ncbi:hypothetical protein GWI33_005334 [Rhynchophorus ferrugineus]|uniref:Uncharacterized protein n=1 Tax=Rhynchophorus ferrugineus TaxID=354439 RepID=A0A834IU32_RHYFE|nr:hypothetical protein GWI33_005334 [Rhynchophorus ferrugineus]
MSVKFLSLFKNNSVAVIDVNLHAFIKKIHLQDVCKYSFHINFKRESIKTAVSSGGKQKKDDSTRMKNISPLSKWEKMRLMRQDLHDRKNGLMVVDPKRCPPPPPPTPPPARGQDKLPRTQI